ncbi:hypothetical protein HII31_08962 [Pseudocercospora fuligena]|uniref:Uncharacterized protein n=1 Tax=Pseudocercospora fuligena TaxID=685502 RepID=A0A8H6RDH4_9PEZI|nr:hypothetical protein HII31_08962 [Pseudocercospora fuligena]
MASVTSKKTDGTALFNNGCNRPALRTPDACSSDRAESGLPPCRALQIYGSMPSRSRHPDLDRTGCSAVVRRQMSRKAVEFALP